MPAVPVFANRPPRYRSTMTATSSEPASAPRAAVPMIAVPGPSAFTRAMILTTLTLVTTLYAMTVTIANVSLPQMQGTLSATTDQIALVVTFNIIARSEEHTSELQSLMR